MWRRSVPIGLLFASLQDNLQNHLSFFGLKSAAAQYGGGYYGHGQPQNKHQQKRAQENGHHQQQNQYQNPWGNMGGDPFAGGGVANHELYKALNVTPDATERDIKSSYRKLALEVRMIYNVVYASVCRES
jgi:hypothetical protein